VIIMATFDFDKIFKGKTPVIYLRVSSQAQAQRGSGVVSQRKIIDDWLISNKLKKKPVVFKDVGSGGNESAKRKGWSGVINFLMDQKDPSKYFVIMRDFTRWSRHVVYGPEAFAWLYRNGVELVSVGDNIATGSEKRADPDGEFLFGLWTALGSRERTGGKVRVQAGVDTARQQLGVIGGQPLDLDGQFRQLWRNRDDLIAKRMSWNAFGQSLKPKRGRSWMVKNIAKFDELEENNRSVDEWLEIFEKVRDVRDKFGKKSKQFKAVQRMTSGFLKKPVEFWQFKPTDEVLENYIKNADDFQVSKGR